MRALFNIGGPGGRHLRENRMSTRFIKSSLLATTVIAGMAIATPAFAQATGNATTATLPPTAPGNVAPAQAQPQTAAAAAATAKDDGEAIIVTGSITRNPATATASPVVTLTSDDLKNRGITTVANALQTLASNNAGTAAPSWSAFGFATGASAPSLRGLNDAYTLTPVQRHAVCPLSARRRWLS